MAIFYAYIHNIRDDNTWRLLLTFASRSVADEWWDAISTSANKDFVTRIDPQFYTHDPGKCNVFEFFYHQRFKPISEQFRGKLFITLMNDRGGRELPTVQWEDSPSRDTPQQGTLPEDTSPEDIPPQEKPPQEKPPPEKPPQEKPPQDIPPLDKPPQDKPPQDIPPQDKPPQGSATYVSGNSFHIRSKADPSLYWYLDPETLRIRPSNKDRTLFRIRIRDDNYPDGTIMTNANELIIAAGERQYVFIDNAGYVAAKGGYTRSIKLGELQDKYFGAKNDGFVFVANEGGNAGGEGWELV